MSTVHIAFTNSPSTLSAMGGKVTMVDRAGRGGNSSAKSPNDNAADDQAINALNAIAGRLSEMQAAVANEAQTLGDQVSQAAAQIARAVMNDDDLVQNRALQFVQIALEQLETTASKTAFVHPSCVNTIQSWVDQSEMKSLRVAGDESVAPGDCRIDCGDNGVLATLDAFLESVAAQSVAGQISH